MHKFLVFTDLHITEVGERIIGLDPMARFTAALGHALARHGDAAAILLLGDLTHHGRRSEYLRLRAVLDGLPLPVHATLGNHDDPAIFAEVFPAQVDAAGFACHALDLEGAHVVLLDTHDRDGHAPRHGGFLCPARRDWLARRLGAVSGPVLLACHHPPFRSGFAGMDAIALTDPDSVLGPAQACPGPVHLLCGHVHRTLSGMVGGLPFSVLKSPCHQMPMVLSASETSLSVDEPGAYGIVLIDAGGVIVHSEDVLSGTSLARDPASA